MNKRDQDNLAKLYLENVDKFARIAGGRTADRPTPLT
jgi:hypothetical protein